MSDRLISANKFKAYMQDKYLLFDHTLADIDAQPTVDAVEVVRCKDCRWFEYDGYHTNCKIMRFCVEAEDYCSRGERREDGKAD